MDTLLSFKYFFHIDLTHRCRNDATMGAKNLPLELPCPRWSIRNDKKSILISLMSIRCSIIPEIWQIFDLI